MGTIFVEEVNTTSIQRLGTADLTLGMATFPGDDSTARATASFGDATRLFSPKSVYQSVATATADVNPETSVVGVEFDGAVTLTFSNTSSFRQVSVVDEGGFCSPVNTISVTSNSASGSLFISSPYAHLQVRINGGVVISESRDTVVQQTEEPLIPVPDVLDDPGANTVVSADGTETITSADGNTVYTVAADGTAQLSVQNGAVNTTTTVAPDGTQTEAVSDWTGNASSTTILPDGTSIQQINSNTGASSTYTVSADGTITDFQESSSGNSTNVVTSVDGTVTTDVVQNNGSSESSVVNPDGSSSSFHTASSGIITITSVSAGGVEVVEIYRPWQNTYSSTTTPPGSTQIFRPNPYQR